MKRRSGRPAENRCRGGDAERRDAEAYPQTRKDPTRPRAQVAPGIAAPMPRAADQEPGYGEEAVHRDVPQHVLHPVRKPTAATQRICVPDDHFERQAQPDEVQRVWARLEASADAVLSVAWPPDLCGSHQTIMTKHLGSCPTNVQKSPQT